MSCNVLAFALISRRTNKMSVIHRVVFPSRLSDIHIHKTTSSIHVYKVSLIEAHAKSILYTNKYKSGLKRHCWVQSNIY